MTEAQRRLRELRERQSQERGRMAELSRVESLDDEQRAEMDKIETGTPDLERQLRAAQAAVDIEADKENETREATPDAEMRERLELRSKCRVGAFLLARLEGHQIQGAEAELAAAAKTTPGKIPLELWERPPAPEKRAVTDAPDTVGVNLDAIRPQIFARSVCPRLGIAMPRVPSGSYASATISQALTAAALAKGASAVATAAGFTVSTSTPKRISARMEIAIEDVAAVGTETFETAIRENLALALTAQLDFQALNGDGQAPSLTGLFQALTDPDAPGSDVAAFDDFVAGFAAGIDGLWASKMQEISIVCGAETYALSTRSFRDGTDDRGQKAFADYAMANFGAMAWWTNARMPDPASNIQQAILYRTGMSEFENDGGIRTATLPIWNEIGIDDIYSLSASGQRAFTMHILAGDIVLQQPAAYKQIAFRVAA
ncbi:MAG: hypothetical protein OXC10_14550 [Rhodospirillaceae bacterium]|nr:hypothetical protein [Rhodospirillaceae bacterium]